MKKYYINEGRHFDIPDHFRSELIAGRFKFYHQYEGERDRSCNAIRLTNDEGFQYVFDYDPDIFVH
jgi:hypothetical protein